MKEEITRKQWITLFGMTIAAFIFNTSEFMPIGLLIDISNDFNMTEARAGMIITIYAWVVMLLSLPLMMLVSRFSYKKLLLNCVAFFGISHIISAIAPSFMILLLSRIGVACAHSIFWSIATPIAVKLVSEKFRSLAMSMVVTGTSIAMIAGLPLGRIIGLRFGWRMTFLSIAVIAFILFFYIQFSFPKMSNGRNLSLQRFPLLLKKPMLQGLYIVTLVVVTAYYISYSYIEPFLFQIAKFSENMITIVLIIFGVSGILGSLFFSIFYNKYKKYFFFASIISIMAVLFLLTPISSSWLLTIFIFAFWGMVVTAYNVSGQAAIINAAPPGTAPVAMSIYSGLYNLGIGLGSWLGGIITTNISISYLGYYGGVIALAGGVYCLCRVVPLLAKIKS